MTTQALKVQELIEQAERQRLHGEIQLRFRDGRLTCIVEQKTIPVEVQREQQRFTACR